MGEKQVCYLCAVHPPYDYEAIAVVDELPHAGPLLLRDVLLKLPSFFMHYFTLAAPLTPSLHLDQNVPFHLIRSLSCCCRSS